MMINVIVHIYNIITTIVLHTSTKNTTTCKKPKILHKTKTRYLTDLELKCDHFYV